MTNWSDEVIDLEGDMYFSDEAIDNVLTADNWDAIIIDMADDEEMYEDVD